MSNFNRGPRPHTWCTGPDPVRHEQYRAWQEHRAQARFHGVAHDLSFDDYVTAWCLHWHLRGRGSEDYTMTRINEQLPWHRDNIHVIPRTLLVRTNKRRGRTKVKEILTEIV